MGFLDPIIDGIDGIQSYLEKRREVTDQATARKERAEIEAKREAKKQAWQDHLEEYKEDVKQSEYEQELARLREKPPQDKRNHDSSGWNPTVVGVQPMDEGETDTPPWMPDHPDN